MTLEQRCEQEIVDLHRFFEAWFTGRVEDSDEVFERFAGVLGPGFALVFPDGDLLTRETVLRRVRKAHNSESENPRYFRIWIENFVCRYQGDGHCLVTYEEWHEDNGKISARVSSALFREAEERPGGLEWLYVHETWLPGRETHVKRLKSD